MARICSVSTIRTFVQILYPCTRDVWHVVNYIACLPFTSRNVIRITMYIARRAKAFDITFTISQLWRKKQQKPIRLKHRQLRYSTKMYLNRCYHFQEQIIPAKVGRCKYDIQYARNSPVKGKPENGTLGRVCSQLIRRSSQTTTLFYRFWKKVFVRLVYQGETPHLELVNKDDGKETLHHEWPLQPCYAISDIGKYLQYLDLARSTLRHLSFP